VAQPAPTTLLSARTELPSEKAPQATFSNRLTCVTSNFQ
jgi:hypothetical protein